MVIHKPVAAELERLAQLAATGALRPLIDSVYPLDRVADAFRRFASGQFTGKIVIALDPALAIPRSP